MAAFKPQFNSEFTEFESPDAGHQKSAKSARAAESVRLALTALALLSSITILGTAGDTLSVFNNTHLGEDYFLPLWPSDFDLRPTVALVVCSVIVFVASALSLTASKLPAVRNKALIHTSISALAPAVCLIAGLIGTSFFYGVNSSNSVSTLQSWSCQWSAVSMDTKPHWGTLCKESKAALYLTVMLIPLEALILGTVAFGAFVEKKQVIIHERKGSPAMS
ncbi:hypothetical protein LSUE1_G002159 [Lachnellula suecica]|uniref:Uncharacterized protein n=1 Tax=Lachnellula suecica TaxID=602035 RepID=A0A8T9CHM8_9HELO|nr:hypothetical protein LSUE1_G002159 [Lachnellula suecica]